MHINNICMARLPAPDFRHELASVNNTIAVPDEVMEEVKLARRKRKLVVRAVGEPACRKNA